MSGPGRRSNHDREPTDPDSTSRHLRPTPDGTTPCPDCGATTRNGRFQHDERCPMGAIDHAAMDDDRRWFERHPGARERWRKPNEWDRWQCVNLHHPHLPDNAQIVGLIRVEQLAPGVRRRDFDYITAWVPAA